MFVPPEQWPHRPPPWQPRPPRRELSKRGEVALLWVVGIVLLLMLLAPIGGSTVLEAIWFLLRRA
jgi:hypothetical protein